MNLNTSAPLESLRNLADFERVSGELLSAEQTAWLLGGAETGRTMDRNIDIFARIGLLPRVLTGVTASDISANFLGSAIAAPILIAPLGHLTAFHPDGEISLAVAATENQLLAIISAHTRCSLEEIVEKSDAQFLGYQLYLYGDQKWASDQIARVSALGFKSLTITVNGIFRSPSYMRQSMPWDLRTVGNHNEPPLPIVKHYTEWTWTDLEILISNSPLPVAVKGLIHPEDCVRAVEAGAQAVWLSNHGGRCLEIDVSAVELVRSVRSKIGDTAQIIVDGGIRTGSDIAKSLCLGADLVAVGRPFAYGLVAGGTPGVSKVAKILVNELQIVAVALGVSTLQDFRRLGATIMNPIHTIL